MVLWSFGIIMAVVGFLIILGYSIVLTFYRKKCDSELWNGYTLGIACLLTGIMIITVSNYLFDRYAERDGT